MRFRDGLAVMLEAGIIAFWGIQGYGILQNISGEVNGALIAVFTLVAQFYFRKKPAEEKA